LSKARWNRLNVEVQRCTKCPRLVAHCQEIAVEKRRAYQDEKYWGKPVPNLGAPRVGLLIVGLAPGAHGANRTGRMFTGDRSGEWLYRAMHRFGFANQANSESKNDGLELIDCAVTNICRCAPPDNKPTREELANCQPYFDATLELCDPVVILALGALAWNASVPEIVKRGWLAPPKKRPKFSHGELLKLEDGRWLLGSYHPSQQNTFTKRLTAGMLDDIFRESSRLIAKES
jgi:uracil-DNA glycosylase family 4